MGVHDQLVWMVRPRMEGGGATPAYLSPRDFSPALLFAMRDGQVLEPDPEGRYRALGRTLFFLPHCGAGLTDALLACNVEAVHGLAILGNAFSTWVERWAHPAARARRRAADESPPDTLLALVGGGRVHESRVPERAYPVLSSFNDLALHTLLPGA